MLVKIVNFWYSPLWKFCCFFGGIITGMMVITDPVTPLFSFKGILLNILTITAMARLTFERGEITRHLQRIIPARRKRANPLHIEHLRPKTAVSSKPGRMAMLIAGMLNKRGEREFMLGDIEERFSRELEKYGKFHASIMIWRDNLADFEEAYGSRILAVIKWVATLTLSATFYKFIEQYISNIFWG